MKLFDKVEWAVSRLVDNYEWQGVLEFEDFLHIQEQLVYAVMADEGKAEAFVNVCLDEGVIEEE